MLRETALPALALGSGEAASTHTDLLPRAEECSSMEISSAEFSCMDSRLPGMGCPKPHLCDFLHTAGSRGAIYRSRAD